MLAIAGPTAAGKSAFALALCERLAAGPGAELVSVDSAQIYRGMDIGSAKPDAATQARVPHHLIDLLDPVEPYSAARFAGDAQAAIAAIRARGRVPILVGGTMLYYRALFDGLSELPPADAALRRELEAEAGREGAAAQHARLARIDPETAARLHPNDAQRVQRALEIHALSGAAPSLWYARPKAGGLEGRVLRIAVMPSDREALNARIAMRFRAMLEAGLVEEVARLRARGDLHPGLPSMRAVGYRQVWQHLDGEHSLAEAERLGVIATRQYAKRQLTWLRGDDRWQSIDAAEPGAVDRVLNEMTMTPSF
ncbi:MAG: tRNA (adenosine(37)-N6)-dimethylallyltransferase MiaA [Nevskia sp.]